MAKKKEEVPEEFKSDVYEHYQNSVSFYKLLRMEAEKVEREIKINAEEHDRKGCVESCMMQTWCKCSAVGLSLT